MKQLLVPVLPTLLSLPIAAQSAVLVVDDDPGTGVDHTQLQDAIDAAVNGEIILVRDGIYNAPVFAFAPSRFAVNHSVTIVADDGANVELHSPVDIIGLDAGESVILRGLTLDRQFTSQTSELNVLTIAFNDGPVWVEECRVYGAAGVFGIEPSESPDTVSVRSASAVFTDCEIIGGGVFSLTAPLGVPLYALDSDVHLYGTSIAPSAFVLVDGPVGLKLERTFLFASGSTIQGGEGTNGTNHPIFGPTCATDGAAAVWLTVGVTDNEAVFQDTTLIGGAPGDDPYCGSAQQGPELLVDQGTATTLPGSARTLGIAGVSTAGTPLDLTLSGEPGEVVLLGVAADIAPLFTAPFGGTLVLAPPILPLTLGVTAPDGSLALTFATPAPMAGTEGRRQIAQAAFVSASGVVLSNGTAVTFLAP